MLMTQTHRGLKHLSFFLTLARHVYTGSNVLAAQKCTLQADT